MDKVFVVSKNTDKQSITIACSESVPIDCREVVNEIKEKYNCKGGGSRTFAQIGSFNIDDIDLIKDDIKKIVKQKLLEEELK